MSKQKNIWQNSTNATRLKHGEIHVWRAFIDREISSLQKLLKTLSSDERNKADKFHFDQDRKQFIVARGSLRKILGVYLNVLPSEISFSYNHFGKPMLGSTESKNSLCFNVSHSNEIVLIAVTREQEVGIDLEFMNEECVTLKVAEKFCSQSEFSDLSALPADLRVSAFYSFWTRKEAFVKAIGEGFSNPLNQITLPMNFEECEKLSSGNKSYRFGQWSIMELPAEAKYAAALSVKGAIQTIRYWQLSESI